MLGRRLSGLLALTGSFYHHLVKFKVLYIERFVIDLSYESFIFSDCHDRLIEHNVILPTYSFDAKTFNVCKRRLPTLKSAFQIPRTFVYVLRSSKCQLYTASTARTSKAKIIFTFGTLAPLLKLFQIVEQLLYFGIYPRISLHFCRDMFLDKLSNKE